MYQEKCGTVPEIDLKGPIPGGADCEVEQWRVFDMETLPHDSGFNIQEKAPGLCPNMHQDWLCDSRGKKMAYIKQSRDVRFSLAEC